MTERSYLFVGGSDDGRGYKLSHINPYEFRPNQDKDPIMYHPKRIVIQGDSRTIFVHQDLTDTQVMTMMLIGYKP